MFKTALVEGNMFWTSVVRAFALLFQRYTAV